MTPLILQQNPAVKNTIALPFITIALQIDTTNVSKAQIEQKIKLSIDKVENDLNLINGIPDYMVVPAINQLKTIMSTLNYNANKKSVVIFLSPFVEKVFYLNFLLEEKVVVGEPLNIRELTLTKREEMKYLVLSLHRDQSFIYLGVGKKLSLIVFNAAEHIKSRFNTGKEKFLSHVDNVLTHILKTYSLPLITVGDEALLSLFKSISKNSKEIIQTVDAKADGENMSYIQQLVRPLIQDWEKIKEKYLLMKLDKALNNKKAKTGIDNVCKAAKEKRGKILIIEKDFRYPFRLADTTELMYANAVSSNGSLLITDPVEDAIERVLGEGGNIEFVSSNVLDNYMHIALIL